MASAQPRVSVILCTFNPRSDLISWVLTSLERQTLPKSEFELIVIDNRSEPPLDPAALNAGRNLPMRVVRENRPGLTQARVTGIETTCAPVIVFVDDDNYLDPDYLAEALRIEAENPWIGCFGGKARGVLETKIPAWKSRLLGYFGVRDYGPNPITSTRRVWGEWEPIGAGMVCRRDVAEQFIRWFRTIPDVGRLGRSGTGLMSGDDTLLAHAAYHLNYACSYQPALKLSHWIKASRLELRPMARIMAGHGRSHVVLQALKGEPIPRPTAAGVLFALVTGYSRRVKRDGFGKGTIEWFWDLGYFSEARR